MHTLSPQSDSLSAMSRSACFVLVLTLSLIHIYKRVKSR